MGCLGRFPITGNLTVIKTDDALGLLGYFHLVGNQHHGDTFLVKVTEDRDNLFSGDAVEVAGGFIGQDQGRLVYKGG